eukprot:365586-Chlamydomonas_euryale.AAC.1
MPERGEMKQPNPGEAFIGSNTTWLLRSATRTLHIGRAVLAARAWRHSLARNLLQRRLVAVVIQVLRASRATSRGRAAAEAGGTGMEIEGLIKDSGAPSQAEGPNKNT